MEERLIGRTAEMELVRGALDLLVDPERLLRTPIVEYNGPVGSGKSAMLREIHALCRERAIACMPDAGEALCQNDGMIQQRLGDEPLVMTVELDQLGSEGQSGAERHLAGLLDGGYGSRLFVALASAGGDHFTYRTITRKTTHFSLSPLDQAASITLLAQHLPDLPNSELVDIFQQTGGYPLGLRTAATIIASRRSEPVKDRAAHALGELVASIDAVLLARVQNPEERERVHHIMTALAIPRRFNLLLAQSVIKEFTGIGEEDALFYQQLVQELQQLCPGALYWDASASGFRIDGNLRPILMAQLSVDTRRNMHKCAKAWYESVIDEPYLSEYDRRRYGEEIAYHRDQSAVFSG